MGSKKAYIGDTHLLESRSADGLTGFIVYSVEILTQFLLGRLLIIAVVWCILIWYLFNGDRTCPFSRRLFLYLGAYVRVVSDGRACPFLARITPR
jgi:hypothetical protein